MSVDLIADKSDATISATQKTATGTISDEDSTTSTKADSSLSDELGDKPMLTFSDAIAMEESNLVFAGNLSNLTKVAEEITLSVTSLELNTVESADINSDMSTWSTTYIDANNDT